MASKRDTALVAGPTSSNFAVDKGAGAGERGNSGVGGVVAGCGGTTGYRPPGIRGRTGVGRDAVRRSREFGYYPMDEHPAHSYRTHLFLSPPAVSSATEDSGIQIGSSNRRNSGPIIKWGAGGVGGGGVGGVGGGGGGAGNAKRKQNGNQQRDPSEPHTPAASRQVSFSAGNTAGATGTYTPLVVSANSQLTAGEPRTLATLDRDCFIIPLASLDHFLPAGVPLAPIVDRKKTGSPLSVLEVEDPKQCILAHLMTPLEPLDPLMESPLACPLVLQRDTAAELLAELAPTAAQSILLVNMERNAEFPFISYYFINKLTRNPGEFHHEAQCRALQKFDPREIKYAASHTLDVFNEVATIARPPLEPPGGRPPLATTGYIISVFKVFEGDDGLKFERNWLYWTGARMIYRYLPKSVGLRRITLHKSMSPGDKMYLLICECAQLQDNLSAAAILLPALRARLCGYTGLYRPSVCF
ncbi:uncharacterized protein [Neodiprion pinetum]|uniref:Uncharacterized protein LOC107228101 isoform X1 n=2 Tax=Neodiprion TaxID=270857 RepID=A0ABM3G6H3_NEOLC|nr:uncharacterized protein LOC124218732 isoform X1 [Neodiprion pinetum]XP_046481431.1 uncharacterized protein LOC124218732 isoform X1 [Neodiprion pinetum]XP_046481432.1 uncharacterized protein LOC124218732 isoform X1 [Neodiprion pinetum]XP_046481433.1 uncharacterized protein LOC124218732 isoform X1 [Neodiprion pinetum]XP_046481435.1 uncharacterized protein LOC124218732 isoform X1 [Neodiprion pinetum]XP_046595871.1 uncharacterized protein LOC107228101 isoform X1 [Neodiprion lecontei]XP_0465958